MRRTLTTTLFTLAALSLFAQPDPVSRSWNQPVEPFRIIGNIYYVGASDIASYLIVTPKGHILIDGGFEETAPMIRANVAKLGFDYKQIKILLNSHAHYDHAGGLAVIKQETGATLYASAEDAPQLERGGIGDPQFGDIYPFPPVKADRILKDNQRITLGGSVLTARLTPGHTKGCTSWTMNVRDKGRTYHVVFLGSISVPSQYRLVGNDKYPDAVADYRRSYRVLRNTPCDVFLASHGNFFDLAGKMARRAAGEEGNPFVDRQALPKHLDAMEKRFESLLEK